MSPDIYVSIIVCTRNRAELLASTLASLARAIQNAPGVAIEVILVDNGSSDHTLSVIKQWATVVPFSVKAVVEDRKGLSIARNTGIDASLGEILVFTDDDCCLNDDYLIALERNFKSDTEPKIRGGKVELGDSSDLPITIKLDKSAVIMTDMHAPGGFILGANMAMHRDMVKAIGLFDERFGAGASLVSGEDAEYVYRAFRSGFTIEYVPDMVVQHFHGRKDVNSVVKLFYGYNIGNGALYAKYIKDRKLLRQFYWDFKAFLRSLRYGGNVIEDTLQISYSRIVTANLHGMLLYWLYTKVLRRKQNSYL